MRVWALRHGQSEYNLLGLCNDDPTCRVDLTAEGRRQAAQAARLLAGKPLDAAYISPLPRAVQTAQIVLRGRALPQIVEPRIADISSGFDGQKVSDYFDAIADDPVNMRVNGGESLRDHWVRVGDFLRWLMTRPQQEVLLVAHEETLRVVMGIAEGLPVERVIGRHFANCRPYAFILRRGEESLD